MRIEPLNEHSCIIYFADEVSEHTADQIAVATHLLRDNLSDVITDMVPSYTSIVIDFDMLLISREALFSRIKQVLSGISESAISTQAQAVIEIPVYYGGEVATDMAEVCQHTGLSAEDVVRLHCERIYRVYAVGFTPGFAYLGSTDEALLMPRKATPRLKVPSGSVGLADNQTAIYPAATPGGWQIIGRTPLKMLDWHSETPGRLNTGDRVRFSPVNRETFIAMGGRFDEF
ncbi:5-oxoprolinase subunit PxpB [Vibrio quintilis]|uniref:Kinase A inhibitor n=1 Tax=Vibrio quintilis TaxID=1117707 RepID=A0A1M7YWD2_9VIBR|nr:5-oxoprolinase subunit PxpB [Vibrio quintilis]SHO56898.1 Kinase A inhibitor [Vibrio quintilis]